MPNTIIHVHTGYRFTSISCSSSRAAVHVLFLHTLLALSTGSKHSLKSTVIFGTAPYPNLATVGFTPPGLLSVWLHMADALVGRLNVAASEKPRVTPHTIILLFGDLCKEIKGARPLLASAWLSQISRASRVAGHNNPSLPQVPSRKPLYLLSPLAYTSSSGEG